MISSDDREETEEYDMTVVIAVRHEVKREMLMMTLLANWISRTGIVMAMACSICTTATGQPATTESEATRNLRKAFQARDTDGSSDLSLEEYLSAQPPERHPQLKRDFSVVDFDRNQRLSWDEFRALPSLPISERGPIPDPLKIWAEERSQAWKQLLLRQDHDGKITEQQWPVQAMLKWGPLGELPFKVWDINQNGTIRGDEGERLIEVSYGIRRSDGSLLRLPTGHVADLMAMSHFDLNRDRLLSRDEFIEKYWLGQPKNEEIFNLRDQNKDGTMDWSEILDSPELMFDTLGQYLYFDTDLNGLVDQTELDAKVQPWQKRLARQLVGAFDDDGDGYLSLVEYRQTPIANHVVDWYRVGEDRDYDGKLSLSEFYIPDAEGSPAFLLQFAYEQFRRWDRNHDGLLSHDEYDFIQAPPKTRQDDFRRRDADGSRDLTLEEFLMFQAEEYHQILKRDFTVVDFNRDGRLSWDEFRALPGGPISERGPVPDPVQNWGDERMQVWNQLLILHDKNKDGTLAETEWPRDDLQKWGSLGEMAFTIWDVNQDSAVSPAEAQQVIDWAYAIRWLDGSLLRLSSGHVADLMAFANQDVNRDGVISLSEIVEKYWQEVVARIDQNHDGKLDWPEIMTSPELMPDTLAQFLHIDANLNGKLDQNELDTRIANWQRKLARRLVAAFDDDGDGELSLTEYRQTPIANLVVNWFDQRQDRDFDGKLSFFEFYVPIVGQSPAYGVQFSYEQFRRWDRNHDGLLSHDEYDFIQAPPKTRQDDFRRRDADGSRDLTLEEFLMFQAEEYHQILKRDFTVVDFNRDGRLSWDEFRALPGTPANERGPVPDPVQVWADDRLKEWRLLVAGHDKDRDGGFAESEWPAEELRNWGPIGQLPFNVWDVDHNLTVSASDAQQVIEWAYGIRRSDRSLLRLATGGVVDLLVIAYFDTDHDGVVGQDEFRAKFGNNPEKAVEIFNSRDLNRNKTWEWNEILAGTEFIVDSVNLFMALDSNLNGLIDQHELDSKAQVWQKKLARNLVAAFDDDGNGELSLTEFRVTPIANLVADWYAIPVDSDFDGKLSFSEFYTPSIKSSPAYLVQFAYEQFQRWDLDDDGNLSREEFEFTTNPANLHKLTDPAVVFRVADKDHDGGLSNEEAFLEPSPDAKNPSAVIDYHRRKMRSEEAFYSADRNRDRRLDLSEYRRYREIMEGVGSKSKPDVAIPEPVPTRSWEEFMIYAMTGVNIFLALIGGLYWAWHRKKK